MVRNTGELQCNIGSNPIPTSNITIMKRKTFDQISLEYDVSDYSEEKRELGYSCGIIEVGELSDGTNAKDQARMLADIFDTAKGQIIISDIASSKAWKATKKIAYKGPITVNPNSGNKIRIYIITKPMVVKIYYSK